MKIFLINDCVLAFRSLLELITLLFHKNPVPQSVVVMRWGWRVVATSLSLLVLVMNISFYDCFSALNHLCFQTTQQER